MQIKGAGRHPLMAVSRFYQTGEGGVYSAEY